MIIRPPRCQLLIALSQIPRARGSMSHLRSSQPPGTRSRPVSSRFCPKNSTIRIKRVLPARIGLDKRHCRSLGHRGWRCRRWHHHGLLRRNRIHFESGAHLRFLGTHFLDPVPMWGFHSRNDTPLRRLDILKKLLSTAKNAAT